MRTRHGVDDLIAALTDLGDRLGPQTVASTLRTLPIDERALAPYLHVAPGRYARNLIARTETFELLAICWDRDAVSAIHDHAEQDCGLVVVRGALACEDWVCTSGGTEPGPCAIARTGISVLEAGGVDLRAGTLSLHRVASDGGPAVSLHVYHAPIDACLNFNERGFSERAFARYDTVPV